jgi:pimeloyl-ACP methyl ester carboxylesterase
MTNAAFERFEALEVEGAGASIFLRRSGSGQPVLLLHGFPRTQLMWRLVAPAGATFHRDARTCAAMVAAVVHPPTRITRPTRSEPWRMTWSQ